MQTQIVCPRCQTPFMADIHQIIDSDRTPELKQMLLNSQLNVAVCPSCRTATQMSSALLFHDAKHQLFMVFVPQELNLSQVDRERFIGQLAQQAMNAIPQQERRAYMLQPTMVLSMQSFMEKVLETEGITKEMIDRQRKQSELLQTLARADTDVANELIKQRSREIDETFFAMLQSYIDQAAQMNENQLIVKLTNLRAKLMIETAAGRKIEKQQIALHGLNRDAKAEEGLSPDLLLKHILLNQDDLDKVDALAQMGQGALNYEFFTLLTEEMERNQQAGETAVARRLNGIRDRLLKLFEGMQAQSRQMMEEAGQTLQNLLQADDKERAIKQNIHKIDDVFMYLLTARITEADQNGKNLELQALSQIHELIMRQAENQYPPEIMLLNDLLEAETAAERQSLLDKNEALINPNFIQMMNALRQQLQEAGAQPELDEQLQLVMDMVKTRVG